MCVNKYIKMNIASVERITKWSQRFSIQQSRKSNLFKILTIGNVLSECIDNKDPEFATPYNRSGLFSETIFGICKEDFLCSCPILLSLRHNKSFTECPYCNIEKTTTNIRNFKMGNIPLVLPFLHVWFTFGGFNVLNLLLGFKQFRLKDFFYFGFPRESYIKLFNLEKKREVVEELISKLENEVFLSTNLDIREEIQKKLDAVCELLAKIKIKQKEKSLIFFEESFQEFKIKEYFKPFIPETTINEEIFNLLKNIDLEQELNLLKSCIYNKLKKKNYFEIQKEIKNLRILENLFINKIDITSIFVTHIPVIPAGLRPTLVDGEKGSTSILNSLYQKILRQNSRIINIYKNMEFYNMTLLINEVRILQESLDFLIDQNKLAGSIKINNKPLKSLVDLIRGKFGHFRKQILGKRVNFSARSVISVNPLLRINQCGIPFDIAKVLFNPHLSSILSLFKIEDNENGSLLSDKNIFIFLSLILKKKGIMLNRAPTLHRFGIQAFNPILVLKKAIQLHPLVCAAYNADFDGDQMSIHVPILEVSKHETSKLIKSTTELFTSSTGDIKLKASQDMVLGLVYLTIQNNTKKQNSFDYYFNDFDFVLNLLKNKKLGLHTPIWFKNKSSKIFDCNQKYFVQTTPGRLLFNSFLS